jgi:hypothetical protein
MIKRMAVLLLLSFALVGDPVAMAETHPVSGESSWASVLEADRPQAPRLPGSPSVARPMLYQYCCKTCSAGKACGDSCISRDKQCRVGAGCACDG